MSERWKPECEDWYYYITNRGEIEHYPWVDDACDYEYYEYGNCFKTEEEAKAAAEKVKALLLSLHEPVAKCNQLPKLTTEVFDRPDCPEDAKIAVVSKNGSAHWGMCNDAKPDFLGGWTSVKGSWFPIPGRWDSSDWQNSLIERPVKENKLPKLTTEVFDREDCPEWAKYAAVNADGKVVLFSDEPNHGDARWIVKCRSTSVNADILDDVMFDASDWKHSLIERPVNLPDWCKADAVCWHKRAGYFKVTYVNAVDDIVYMQQLDDKSIGYLSFNTVCNEVKQANFRPYDEGEMRAVVGKPITMPDGAVCLCTAYSKQNKSVIFDSRHWKAQKLRDSGCTIDGKPCGVLEHLNDKGEWVE